MRGGFESGSRSITKDNERGQGSGLERALSGDGIGITLGSVDGNNNFKFTTINLIKNEHCTCFEPMKIFFIELYRKMLW